MERATVPPTVMLQGEHRSESVNRSESVREEENSTSGCNTHIRSLEVPLKCPNGYTGHTAFLLAEHAAQGPVGFAGGACTLWPRLSCRLAVGTGRGRPPCSLERLSVAARSGTRSTLPPRAPEKAIAFLHRKLCRHAQGQPPLPPPLTLCGCQE